MSSHSALPHPPQNQAPARDAFVIQERVVGCDGGGGALGHPMVYLHVDETGNVTCPYCSRHFKLA